MKTVLSDRILWWDGTNQVREDTVPSLLIAGVPTSKIISSGPMVDQFNKISYDEVILSDKDELSELPSPNWNIDRKYLDLDLSDYFSRLLSKFLQDNPKCSKIDYEFRLTEELKAVSSSNLEMLIRTIIFVLDRFRQTNQVWGVGRGSSCASLMLFLIGLHKVDPVKYRISMEEFFHE